MDIFVAKYKVISMHEEIWDMNAEDIKLDFIWCEPDKTTLSIKGMKVGHKTWLDKTPMIASNLISVFFS